MMSRTEAAPNPASPKTARAASRIAARLAAFVRSRLPTVTPTRREARGVVTGASSSPGGHDARVADDYEVRAAGAAVWRRAGGAVEWAVIHRPRYDDWSLAKGKL